MNWSWIKKTFKAFVNLLIVIAFGVAVISVLAGLFWLDRVRFIL